MLRRGSILLTLFLSGSLVSLAAKEKTSFSDIIPLTECKKLEPGKFEWDSHRSDQGTLSMTVDLSLQMMEVFRGGILIARSSVCTGRNGHSTPCGAYNILGKEEMHHSNLYDNAPMPFMMRLTCDGVALHSGYIAETPSSHGCIRLPKEFAKRLFETVNCGDSVTIIRDFKSPLPSTQPVLDSAISAEKQPPEASLSLSAIKEPSTIPQNISDKASVQPVKSLSQLEDEELKIRKDPSLTSTARIQKLQIIWAQQLLLAKKKPRCVSLL